MVGVARGLTSGGRLQRLRRGSVFGRQASSHTEKYENIQNNRIGWADDHDRLEFSRVACVEDGIGEVFFRPMVVELVSGLYGLAGICHYRLRQLLQT
ncbi:MAG: hypothetical protein ABR955_13295 [Verrucomicrobiota bacterium]|jgi:hypothetical protein